MLSNDEHPGLFAFLIGLIVVVFAAIALSIAVDRRFSFSSSVSALEAEIQNNEPELERLRTTHRETSWRLLELEPQRKAAAATLASLEKDAEDLKRRLATLVSERARLAESIPVIEEEFASYRRKYRAMVRDAATGESIGVLTTLGGREYKEAFVMQVSAADLEIRHAHGTARIPATDLAPAWHDRFQWDDGQRRAEDTLRQVMARPPEAAVVVEKPAPDSGPDRPDSRKADMLRRKVTMWKAKVSQLRQERSRALISAGGSQASVPGSLETWQARAARLGTELETAEAELAAAQAELVLALQGTYR